MVPIISRCESSSVPTSETKWSLWRQKTRFVQHLDPKMSYSEIIEPDEPISGNFLEILVEYK